VAEGATEFYTERELSGLSDAVRLLRDGREAVLRDWMDRVRSNRAMQTGQALSEPLLLDHIPHLMSAVFDRLEVSRTREDAEQLAAVHGFTRRLSGYDVAETVLELLMLRRAIWAYLVAQGAEAEGAYAAMEQVDGMLDRAIIASLRAFLDPNARVLRESGGGDATGES
jgi:hypothetical protein